jgi:cytosol alanyl aminopeptidase
MKHLWIVVAAGCGAASTKPAEPPPAPPPVAAKPVAADPKPPEFRLPTTAHPTRYQVDVTVDPTSDDFTGTITSELEFTSASSVLWLNATEITIESAVLTVGADHLTARVIPVPKNFVGLAFPHDVSGRASLAIKYRGKAHADDGDGIYRAKERDEWYAFTQFENTSARQAFPCFDEPSYKVPWQITIHTKKDLVAVSNMPSTGETDEPNGMKAVHFAETPALPSYLVAFAVGPFELVDAGKTAGGTPIRIVVPHGRSADATYPAQATKPLLELLERYFGIPYPFAKLDIVAVSVFNAGAMENAGLITFRQSIILVKPGELTLGRQQTYATVAAHEMAHMWFGDYVTMSWWDDTWLNESFASWMETKIVEQWKPEWKLDVDAVETRSGIMGQDSLDAARSIRQTVKSDDDISNSFDGITYEKGEAVLNMVEHSIGADAFQKGVRAYLAKHARGNATYSDFVGAMTETVGKDLHPLFDSFVLQSGVPSISFELSCAKGAPPSVKLEQHRYKPIGSKIDPNRTWNVPVCMKWGVGQTSGTDCTTLTEVKAEVALTAKSCPDWLLPDDAGIGYYRSIPRGDLLERLIQPHKAVTLNDRVGLIGDVTAAVGSGEVQNGVALQLVQMLSKDNDRHIVDQSIAIVAGIVEMVPDNLRANYERFINKLYRTRARELGWQSKPTDSEDVKQLRPELLALVAGEGKDQDLIKQASVLAWKWVDDHKAITPEMAGTVLHVAARFGDQKLFDRLHADAKKTQDREERGRLLGALSAFVDPALVKQALAIVLTDEFELRETAGLLQGGLQDPRTRPIALAFAREHFDEVTGKLPAPYRAYMAYMFVAVCDEDKKADVVATFTDRVNKFDGGPRIMAQAMEALSLCAAARKAQTPGVVAFLKKQ